MIAFQTTLRNPVVLTGIGVHRGQPARVVIHPAEAGHGIVFLRTGLPGGPSSIVASHASVVATELCTVLGDQREGGVATIEHLMSALAGLGVDNALVEVDGPEMPILDGSALPFVEAIESAGIKTLAIARRHVRVLRTVRVDQGDAFCELRPNLTGLHLDVEIDFESKVIGRQRKAMALAPAAFKAEIASSRTFGFMRDVQRLWSAGFALGASLENTVAVAENGVANPEGLRHPDEFVRHKMMDAVGDLSLSGLPLIAAFRSYKGGHRMNVAILQELFSDTANYAITGSPLATRRANAAQSRGMKAAAL